MELKLVRVFKSPMYTIGRLYVDGVFECDTLEDTVRDLNKDGDLNDAGESKVFGETAIPYGTYKVIINYSNRFKRDLPRLLNVKEFDGVLIHPGNTAVDTHGCILVGINNAKGRVNNSRITFDKLFAKMKNQTDIKIIVE
jgi:hypothetical protein